MNSHSNLNLELTFTFDFRLSNFSENFSVPFNSPTSARKRTKKVVTSVGKFKMKSKVVYRPISITLGEGNLNSERGLYFETVYMQSFGPPWSVNSDPRLSTLELLFCDS